MPHTDETRITLFCRKAKDLANRNGQDVILVAIGFVYVLLIDILEKLGGAAGMFKSEAANIRKREE